MAQVIRELQPVYPLPERGLWVEEEDGALSVRKELNCCEQFVDVHVQAGAGDKICLVQDDTCLSYRELQQLILGASAYLREQGVQAGDYIVFYTTDSPAALACILAGFRLGAVATLINPFLNQDTCEAIIADIPVRQVLVAPDLMAKVEQQQLFSALPKTSLALDSELFNTTSDADVTIESAIPALAVAPHHPCLCLFTSGSTGLPKKVLHSHGDLINLNLNYAHTILNITDQDVIYSPSKLFFAYGFNAIHMALFQGAKAVMGQPTLDYNQVLGNIQQHQVTLFFSVPTIYMLLLAKGDPGYCLDSVRAFVSAGEPLPAEILQKWQAQYGKGIIDGIGSTEVLSTFISNRLHDITPNCSGTPVPGFQIKLVDLEGQEVIGPGTGTLYIKGNTLTKGYLREGLIDSSDFADGYFKSSDLYRRDHAGRYRFMGRSNEVVKVGAVWVSSHRIESAVEQHPAVLECAVTFSRSIGDLVRPTAHVVLHEGHNPDVALESAIIAHTKSTLSFQEYPHFVCFIDSIPKTSSGKKQRYKLSNE